MGDIKKKKAYEYLEEDYFSDIYSEIELGILRETDELSDEEEGFMEGYIMA